MKAFDASVMFDCPEDAAEGAAALQASGYELTLNPDIKDEYEGKLLTRSVFGVIRGMLLDEEEITAELEEVVEPFGGLVEEAGYSSPDSCCKYDPRYDEFIRARARREGNPSGDEPGVPLCSARRCRVLPASSHNGGPSWLNYTCSSPVGAARSRLNSIAGSLVTSRSALSSIGGIRNITNGASCRYALPAVVPLKRTSPRTRTPYTPSAEPGGSLRRMRRG
jgi:hypothetical protein